MGNIETIDLKNLEKNMHEMENDDLQEFFLLIHSVENKILDGRMPKL